MKSILDIDKNFRQQTYIEKNDAVFFDVKKNMQYVHGLILDNGCRRMPEKIAKKISEGVYGLNYHTSGGRICFATDSEYIILSCKLSGITPFPHIPLTGQSSFDVYADGIFHTCIRPENAQMTEYTGICQFEDRKMRNITINFPLYNDVEDIHVGLQLDAIIEENTDIDCKKPVVFYGSSITQGGCASRPGLCYTSIVCRKLHCDYINLGFSGNAKGEPVMAEYIASLDMSVFVMDYDHNAPTPEQLEETHEKFFEIIRKANPELPVVFITKPDFKFSPEYGAKRREIIYKTYTNAIAKGDKKVWFIDGEKLWGDTDWDCCTMDRCHPNDLGFMRMAEAVLPTLEEALKKSL